MPWDFRLGRSTEEKYRFFDLAYKSRDEGTIIIGGNRMGKSSLMLRMVEHDINWTAAAIVLDPHGDLINDILASRFIHSEDIGAPVLPQKIHLLQIDTSNPFGLNLYECNDLNNPEAVQNTVDNVISVFARVFGEDQYQPRIQAILRHTAYMMVYNQLTMAEIPWLFASRQFRDECMKKTKNSQTEQFWIQYDRLRPWEKSLYLEGAINRLDHFLSSDIIYRIVSQRHTTVPFREIFSNGGILLVALPPRNRELANFLGSVFLAILSQTAWEQSLQPKQDRRLVHIYLDEYGRFASTTSSSLLKEGGKLNLGTTIAHQTLSDLKDEENRQAELQAGNLILFQLTGDDSEVLVKNLTVPEIPGEERKEPLLRPIQEPFKYLVNHIHSNPGIQKKIEKYFVPLEQQITQLEYATIPVAEYQTGLFSSYITKGQEWKTELVFYASLHQLKHGRELLNQLLLNAMLRDEPITLKTYAERLKPIIEVLRAFIKVARGIGWNRDSKRISEQRYMEDHDNLLEKPELIDGFREVLNLFFADLHYNYASIELKLRELWKSEKYDYPNFIYIRTFGEGLIENLVDFTNAMLEICKELHKNPIMVASGEYEIKKEPKPFNERRAILAQKLATLPRYTAYVRVHDAQGRLEEGEVRTFEPDPPTEERIPDIEVLKRIREVSRKFTAKWEDIEKDIEQRQAIVKQTLQTTPPVKKTPEEPDTHPLVSRSQVFYPQ